MKIIFLAADIGGSGYYRIKLPVKYISKIGVEGIYKEAPIYTTELEEADIVILQRQSNKELIKWIENFRKQGKKVFHDLDDDYFSISYNNPSVRYWSTTNLMNLKSISQVCNGLIVSTDFLKERVKSFNDNVKVFGNYLEKVSYAVRPKNDIIRIGWFGSNSHSTDFSYDILSALQDVKKHFKHKVRFIFGGWKPQNSILKINQFCPWVTPDSYLNFLNSLHIDIGLIVVQDTKFNHSKSIIKCLEYIECGILPVASNVFPYSSIKGLPLISNTYQAWKTGLINIIENIEKRDSIISEIKRNIGNYYIADNIYKYKEVIE